MASNKTNKNTQKMRIFLFFTQNRAMEYWVLFVIFIVLLILFFPLFFQIRFYVNVFENMATISITLCGVFVLNCFQVELRQDALNFLSPKRENKEKQIKLVDLKNSFLYTFAKEIFNKMRLCEISVFNSVGKTNDAFSACMISGFYLCFVHSLLSIMQTIKGKYAQNVGTIVDCDEDCLKMSGYFSIKISNYKIVRCFVVSLVQKIKTRGVYGKQK